MEKELFTPQQLADKMQVSRQTVYQWIHKGMPVEIKTPPRFVWADCKNWFDNRKVK